MFSVGDKVKVINVRKWFSPDKFPGMTEAIEGAGYKWAGGYAPRSDINYVVVFFDPKITIIKKIRGKEVFVVATDALKVTGKVKTKVNPIVPVKKEEEEKPTKQKESDFMTTKKITLKDYLINQKVSESIIKDIAEFRKIYSISEELQNRIVKPSSFYFGSKVLNMAIIAILEGKHIILEGAKATGKNILAYTLSLLFNRPVWELSCHVHVDDSSLIGVDTYKNGEVQFQKGHVVEAMESGGFIVLDEINFGRPEALAVLHSATDIRKKVDVPGYGIVQAHPAYRVIATMNYGYSGTKELNEALADRFMVIHVPPMDKNSLLNFLKFKFNDADARYLEHFADLFIDLQKKADHNEISSKSISIRGLLDALTCIRRGLQPKWALEIGVINKTFDDFERKVVRDTVNTRISNMWKVSDIFPKEEVK